jgi:hypothetical protein
MSYSSTVDDAHLSLLWVLKFVVIPLYILSVWVMIWTNSPLLGAKTLFIVTLMIIQIINIVSMITDFFSVLKALSSVSKGFPTVKMITMIVSCCIACITMFTVNTLLGF